MKALDTNVIVRVVTGDDPTESARAAEEMSAGPLLLTRTVILETAWVLTFTYELDRAVVADTLRRLVGYPEVVLDEPAVVAAALAWFEAGMDLADALHLASAGRATEFVTFDRKLRSKARALGAAPAVRLLAGR